MKYIVACASVCILLGVPSSVLGWTLIGAGPDRMKQYFQYVDFENLYREKDVVHFSNSENISKKPMIMKNQKKICLE